VQGPDEGGNKYVGYSEINVRWAVKKNKKEGKIFYYMQKLAT